MSETPRSLIERLAQSPDEPSWGRFAQLYTPLIRHRLLQQGVSTADAEDLLQEILMVIVRELPGFDHSGRRGAFRSWVRTITVNRLRGYWRARNQAPQGDLAKALEELESPDGELARSWDREHDEHIARRLLELVEPEFAPNTWLAFRRTVVDGKRPAEVAEEMGLTINAVLIAKSRVLRRLRAEGRGLLGDELK